MSKQEAPVFADGKRRWVYPMKPNGHFDRLRRRGFVLLQAWMFLTPWLSWRGLPLIEVDLAERRMFVFGSIYTAQDTIFLVLAVLGAAFALFLVTALWGRVWCGYACPQTVFLDGWIHTIERRIEGSRGKRMALDRTPWTPDWIRKKVLKHTIFAALAVTVSMTTVSWFADPQALWSGAGTVPQYGTVGALSAAFYFDFAWFREQFCNYLCPYARFQGALSGPNSFTVTYDVERGEPRKKGRRTHGSAAGACIDCNKCVAVCPAGIDIRDGFQMECIACTRCIDACTGVMTRLKQPTLVRYSTVDLDKGATTHRWVRLRTVLYSVLILGLAGTSAAMLAQRHEIQGTVNRIPGALYTVDNDGWVRNTYMVRLVNTHPGEPATFGLSVEGLPEAEVIAHPIEIPAAEARTVPLIVRVAPETVTDRTVPVRIVVIADHDRIELSTTFKSNAAEAPSGS